MKRSQGISSQRRVDGSISWRYRFKHGKEQDGRDKYVTQAGFSTMREAATEMARQKAMVGKPSRVTRGDITFGQFFLEWLDYAGSEWSPKTLEVNRYHAERAILRMGQLPLSKITGELLDKEQHYLLIHGKKTRNGTAPLSPKSVKETFTLVKAAFRHAKKWNRISVDPAVDLEVPAIKRRRVQVLQVEYLDDVFRCLNGTRNYALVVFAAASGCRRGEILALLISDVNFATGEVTINKSLEKTKRGLPVKTTKSDRPRCFTLPEWALPVLREHIALTSHEKQLLGPGYTDQELLFPKQDGRHYDPDVIGVGISKLLKRKGIATTLHGLRHFNASWLLSNKVPLPIVSERLGHANPAITLEVYSHVMKADDAAAARILTEGLKRVVPGVHKMLRPILVTQSDTGPLKTGTED